MQEILFRMHKLEDLALADLTADLVGEVLILPVLLLDLSRLLEILPVLPRDLPLEGIAATKTPINSLPDLVHKVVEVE